MNQDTAWLIEAIANYPSARQLNSRKGKYPPKITSSRAFLVKCCTAKRGSYSQYPEFRSLFLMSQSFSTLSFLRVCIAKATNFSDAKTQNFWLVQYHNFTGLEMLRNEISFKEISKQRSLSYKYSSTVFAPFTPFCTTSRLFDRGSLNDGTAGALKAPALTEEVTSSPMKKIQLGSEGRNEEKCGRIRKKYRSERGDGSLVSYICKWRHRYGSCRL